MKNLDDKRKGAGHRLAIIEGHLKKVRSMVEHGAECLTIVHQSRAIQQALKKFDEHLLQQHVRICIARDMRTHGLTSEKAVQELVDAFDRF